MTELEATRVAHSHDAGSIEGQISHGDLTAPTLAGYTADDESAAYTGIDNAQVGTVYAQLADLNALRTAVENLRTAVENLRTAHT